MTGNNDANRDYVLDFSTPANEAARRRIAERRASDEPGPFLVPTSWGTAHPVERSAFPPPIPVYTPEPVSSEVAIPAERPTGTAREFVVIVGQVAVGYAELAWWTYRTLPYCGFVTLLVLLAVAQVAVILAPLALLWEMSATALIVAIGSGAVSHRVAVIRGA